MIMVESFVVTCPYCRKQHYSPTVLNGTGFQVIYCECGKYFVCYQVGKNIFQTQRTCFYNGTKHRGKDQCIECGFIYPNPF